MFPEGNVWSTFIFLLLLTIGVPAGKSRLLNQLLIQFQNTTRFSEMPKENKIYLNSLFCRSSFELFHLDEIKEITETLKLQCNDVHTKGNKFFLNFCSFFSESVLKYMSSCFTFSLCCYYFTKKKASILQMMICAVEVACALKSMSSLFSLS